MREAHRCTVLNYIRVHGPVSRTQICKKTGISKPTVTRVIEELVCQDIIREIGQGESSVGRKPVYIEINPKALYCIGVNISRYSLKVAVVDFAMNVVSSMITSIKGIKRPDFFTKTVADSINQLILDSGIDRHKIIGIGIGVPGIVDYRTGIILDFATIHNLMDIPLKKSLEEMLGLKVLVDNNANTRALGEYWYGYGSGFKDIIFVICSEGVGSGVISNGNILRGKNNVVGELGHMTVNLDGKRCVCGKIGCVETYCSTEALEEVFKDEIKKGKVTGLTQKADGDIDKINYKHICVSAMEGDEMCKELLEASACILSAGLSNLVGILNPEMIILSGDLFDSYDPFFEMVEKMTYSRIFSSLAQEVVFKRRKVKDSLYEIGAATLVYKQYFKN